MPETLLEVVNLTKSYRDPAGGGRRRVLAGIRLRLETAAGLGVIGPSGSGKSTLARLLVGLERPDDGAILLHGRRIDLAQPGERRRLRRAVQIVWQDPLLHLNPFLTVRQALEEALEISGAPGTGTEELCDAVHLSRALLDRRPGNLSGGEAQRVALARALAVKPEVLVCDEALCGLDLPVQRHLVELLRDLRTRRGIALIFISHDVLPVAALCDEVTVLAEGTVVEYASPASLRRFPRHPVTRALFACAGGGAPVGPPAEGR